MRLTNKQLEKGRKLLAAMKKHECLSAKYMQRRATLVGWCMQHIDALLADPEEIAREAVREFAEASLMSSSVNPINSWDDVPGSVIRQLAAARGVALNEKP